jgi:hypothetical protein
VKLDDAGTHRGWDCFELMLTLKRKSQGCLRQVVGLHRPTRSMVTPATKRRLASDPLMGCLSDLAAPASDLSSPVLML